ncbi:hypothetical protein AVEN_80746-1 [Araneus ventricosus]|uniref:Uncharacterized protein n=1 Tax=Araneus ventricosus TaxID=182803 RepID=A0A4Y2MPS9_ARAVE|nr:hypothetical protein AVEN_80746-1 [Araneus ventricosus]
MFNSSSNFPTDGQNADSEKIDRRVSCRTPLTPPRHRPLRFPRTKQSNVTNYHSSSDSETKQCYELSLFLGLRNKAMLRIITLPRTQKQSNVTISTLPSDSETKQCYELSLFLGLRNKAMLRIMTLP